MKSLDNCKIICHFVTNLQIGYRHVVDATLQEEACSLASLLISVTSKGALTSMKKVGKGSLDPESIFEMMEVRSFEQWLSRMILDELELGYMKSCSKDFKSRDLGALIRCTRDLLKVTDSSFEMNGCYLNFRSLKCMVLTFVSVKYFTAVRL